MLIMTGLEVNIQLGASKGIKAYQDYWERMQSYQEEDLIMEDINQGLNNLLKPGTFLLTPRALVTKNHKIPNLEIQVSIEIDLIYLLYFICKMFWKKVRLIRKPCIFRCWV